MNQIMAVRMAIAKSVIAYYQKYYDESTKRYLKETLLQYDKGLIVCEARRCEPKKFGGKGARARFQKNLTDERVFRQGITAIFHI